MQLTSTRIETVTVDFVTTTQSRKVSEDSVTSSLLGETVPDLPAPPAAPPLQKPAQIPSSLQDKALLTREPLSSTILPVQSQSLGLWEGVMTTLRGQPPDQQTKSLIETLNAEITKLVPVRRRLHGAQHESEEERPVWEEKEFLKMISSFEKKDKGFLLKLLNVLFIKTLFGRAIGEPLDRVFEVKFGQEKPGDWKKPGTNTFMELIKLFYPKDLNFLKQLLNGVPEWKENLPNLSIILKEVNGITNDHQKTFLDIVVEEKNSINPDLKLVEVLIGLQVLQQQSEGSEGLENVYGREIDSNWMTWLSNHISAISRNELKGAWSNLQFIKLFNHKDYVEFLKKLLVKVPKWQIEKSDLHAILTKVNGSDIKENYSLKVLLKYEGTSKITSLEEFFQTSINSRVEFKLSKTQPNLKLAELLLGLQVLKQKLEDWQKLVEDGIRFDKIQPEWKDWLSDHIGAISRKKLEGFATTYLQADSRRIEEKIHETRENDMLKEITERFQEKLGATGWTRKRAAEELGTQYQDVFARDEAKRQGVDQAIGHRARSDDQLLP